MQYREPDDRTPLSHRVLFGLLVLLALFSPLIEGAVSGQTSTQLIVVAVVLITATIVAFLGGAGHGARLIRRLGPALVSVALSVTLFDMAARTVLTQIDYYRSDDRHVHLWESMPSVERYDVNVDETTRTFGDLAAISGLRDLRDYRDVRFVTDANGFHNITPLPATTDVILLGDSFAAGAGTTQDQTWGELLRAQYGFRIYDIAVIGDGLWTEYINLAVTLDQIYAHPGTTVIWAIYTGNDLADKGLDTTTLADLPWNDPLAAARAGFQVYRRRSPIDLLVGRLASAQADAGLVLPRKFLNGRSLLFYRDTIQYAGMDRQAVDAYANFPALVKTIRAMKQLADRRQLKVDIVILPTKDEVYHWVLSAGVPWTSDPAPSGFSQAITQVAQADGMCALDLKPAFITQSRQVYEQSGQSLWWYDDTHWNASGHSLAASLIHDLLTQETCPTGALRPSSPPAP